MRTRPLLGGLVALGLSLSLAACGGDEDTDATPEPAPAPTQTEEPTESEEPTTEDATTETSDQPSTEAATTETTTDSTGAAATTGASGGDDGSLSGESEPTPPGTTLVLGEPAVIQQATVADTEDDYYRYLKLSATVTEITQADPSLLDGVELATPIEDEIPYLIWADVEILGTEGDYETTDLLPRLGAQHDDGSGADVIYSPGTAIGECESEDFASLEVGQTGRLCVVALAEDGMEITHAVWAGNDNADGGGDFAANPYNDDPVTWGP